MALLFTVIFPMDISVAALQIADVWEHGRIFLPMFLLPETSYL
jgi:hypothetical protein